MSIVLEKTKEFDNLPEEVKKKLEEEALTREFRDFEEINSYIISLISFFKDLYHTTSEIIFFPEKEKIKIESLPFTINEWPLYHTFRYRGEPLNDYEVVAKAKVKK